MPEFDPNPPAYGVATGAYPTNTMDVGKIDRAGSLAIEAQQRDTRPAVFAEREQTGADVFAASFHTGTSVGALMAQAASMRTPSADNPTMTATEAYDRAVKDGLGRYAAQIAPWASTEADYQQLVRQARQEEADAQTIAASGKLGHAIAFGAGLLDPVNYVPVIGVAGRVARTGSMARTALNAAEAGLVSTAASEAIQQSSSVTRTPGESATNIAFGTLFSAALGSTIHKMVGHDAAVKIEDRADRAVDAPAMQKEVADNLSVTRQTTGVPEPLKKVDTLPDTITPDNVDAHYDAVAARVPSVHSESTGLADLGGMARGIGDSLRDALWVKVQAGEISEAHALRDGKVVDVPSRILVEAKTLRDEGKLKTREEFDAFTENWPSSPQSAGAGSALTSAQRAEVNRIAQQYPNMDRADIIDSVLASHGQLSINKIRPGIEKMLENDRQISALDLEERAAARFSARYRTAKQEQERALSGEGFNTLWSDANGVPGTTPIKELLSLYDRHLKGEVSYNDIAEHLTEKFGKEFSRGSVAGTISRLREKGALDKITKEPFTHVFSPVVTPENVAAWLRASGVKDVRITEKTNKEGTVTRYVKGVDPNQPSTHRQAFEVRIPDDNHPGRKPTADEVGSYFDTGSGHKQSGATGSPYTVRNVGGEPYSDWDSLIGGLKWRLARSPDGQFLVSPEHAPNLREAPAPELTYERVKNPDKQLELPFGVEHIKAAQEARSAGAAGTEFQGLSSSSRLDTRFWGLDPVAMLKNGNKVFTSAPIRGAAGIAAKGAEWLGIPAKALKSFAENPAGENAVSQGMRQPFLNLQDSASPAARSYASKAAIAGDPIFMKTDRAGIVTHGDNNFTEHWLPIHTDHVEATRITDETWRKHRAELTKPDGSPMSREDYALEVSKATIEGGRHDNPIIASAARSVRKVFDAVLNKFNEADILDPGKQLRNAETYAPIVYLPDHVRADRGGFIEQHTKDFTNQFEGDYGKALTAKKDNDRTMKAAVEALQKQVDEKIAALDDAKAQDIAQRRQEHADRRDALKVEKTAALSVEGLTNAKKLQIERRFAKNGAKNEQRLKDELKDEHDTYTENVDKEKARVEEEKAKFADKLSEYDTNVLRLNTPEKRADKAREMAEHHYDRVTNNSSGVLLDADLPRGLTGFGQVLKARTTATSHLTLLEKEWAEPNIFRSMDQYVRRAGTAAAMANTFKREVKIPKNELVEGGPTHRYVGDPGARSVRAEIGTDFDELIKHAGEKSTAAEQRGDFTEQAKHTAVETSLTQQKKQALADFDTLHGLRLNDHGGGQNSIDIGQAGPLLQIFANLRFMGGTVAASIGDPINAIIAHGFANSMKYGFIPAAKNFKQAWLNVLAEDLPDHLRILQMTGAATEHVLNSRLAAATDLGNPGASKTMNVANLVNKQFWRITGLSGWTNLMKDITGTITHGRLIEHSQRGWENLSVGERTWLTNLKIGEEGLPRIADMYAEQTAAGHGTSGGIPYARTRDLSLEGRGDYTGWSDREIAAKVEAAVFRESHNVAVTPTADDKLALTATPVGRLLWQYRNFGVAMTGRVIGRNAALAGIDDAARMNFYQGVAGMVMAGVLVDFLKTMAGEATDARGPWSPSKNHANMDAADVWAKKWQTDPGAQMYHALDRSAVMWPITEASNVLHTMGLPNIESVAGKALGDKSQENPGRFGHRGVVEAALGPSVGLLSDVPGALKDISGFAGYELGMNPNYRYDKSAFQRDRRLLPLQSTVPAQQLLNYGHRWLGTQWNWPEPR